MLHRLRAFTYIELIGVMTLTAVLAAIAVPNFLEAQQRSLVAKAKAEMAVLKMAIEQYRQEYRAFPPNRTPGRADGFDLVALTTPVTFIQTLPMDPFTLTEGRRDSTHQIPPQPYPYFNAVQVSPKEGLVQPDDARLLPGSHIGGLLWSRGPNTSWPHAEDGDTSLSALGAATLLIYDATNGTVSPGDIYTAIP